MTRPIRVALAGLLLALMVGCSGGGGSSRAAHPASSTGGASTDGSNGVGSAASGSRADQGEAPVPPISWRPCPQQGKDLECATVVAPLDRARKASGTFDFQVSRQAATDQANRLGVLLLSPGGPGISGISFPVSFRSLAGAHPDDAATFARFDLIGFAPRGTGTNPLSCGDFTPLRSVDPSPTDGAGAEALKGAAKKLARVCTDQDKSARRLPTTTTMDTAEDLDGLREALGEQKVNLYGLSYGTRLFATYSALYPTRVRAAVLDAPVAPTTAGLELARGQMTGLDQEFTAFLSDCAKHPDCPFGDGDPVGAFDRLLKRWDQQAMPVPDGPSLTATQAMRGYTAALFNTYQRPALLQALADAQAGDIRSSSKLWEASQSPEANPAAALATLCNDYSWPAADQLYDALVTKRATPARLSPGAAVSYLPCGSWPSEARPSGRPGAGWPTGAKGAPPMLIFGATGDPSTPYVWAQQLAKELDKAALVTREGVGHVSFSRGTCISQVTARYLVDLQLPAAGLHCPTEL